MTDSSGRNGGDDPAGPSSRPGLPRYLDPRRAHGGVPPGPRTSSPAQPRRKSARVLSWLAVITSVAVLASALSGYLLLNHYDGKLNRIKDLGLGADRPADLPRDAQNILIVGSDSRGDLAAGTGSQGSGDTFVTGQRSDTVILAHLYGDTDQAQLVSFPRDSWVEIPDYKDPKTGKVTDAHSGKLNSAFFEGGPLLLIDTIEELSGVFIDHYMQIDFDGFQAIVNRLNGVEVCLSKPAKEKDSGIDLPAGRQTIKGDQALAFVRQRKGLPNGDIDRIRRQQQFIGAIVRKVLSAGTLLNPLKLNGVISDATKSLEVDEGLTIGDLQDLALRFRNFNAGGVIFETVPVEDTSARRDGQSVVMLDESKLTELFDRLRRDVAPDTPDDAKKSEPSKAVIVAPGAVRVKVFNGAGVKGLGRKAYDDLEGIGFQLVGQPDNRGSSAKDTTVFYGPDKADSARTLAAAIPDAKLELDPQLDRTLEVVFGSSYSGAKPVKVTGTAPSKAPSGSAPPAVVTAAADPCAA